MIWGWFEFVLINGTLAAPGFKIGYLATGAFLATIALFGEAEALLFATGAAFGASVSFLSNWLVRSLSLSAPLFPAAP